MEFLIITGLSGAGKSRAIDVCEDMDYFCVDNLPLPLLGRFAELCLATRGRFEKVALGLDCRSGGSPEEVLQSIAELETMNCGLKILFLEASDSAIIRRYKESRRPHPLAVPGQSLAMGIGRDRAFMAPLRKKADAVIDTSTLSLNALQSELYAILAPDRTYFTVSVNSFGFKHGIPPEADMVFDVRCLPNPFWVEELKPLCGLDEPVRDYIFDFENSRIFLDKLLDLLRFLLPRYEEEGRHTLNIAVGCTGGRHRSVAVAKALSDHLAKAGYDTTLTHRDLERSAT